MVGGRSNQRLDAAHSGVTALAQGRKRRATGRARQAQRSANAKRSEAGHDNFSQWTSSLSARSEVRRRSPHRVEFASSGVCGDDMGPGGGESAKGSPR